MANSVAAALAYIALLDKAYKAAAKSSILDVAPAQVRASENVGTFYIPKLTLVGMGNYSATDGFPAGDVTLEWVAYTYSQDRGREFTVDAVEEMEAAMQAFGNLAAEFMRLHEVPEIDAYRFATIATGAGTDVAATLTAGADAATAANLALTTLREAEVEDEELVTFITPTFLGLIKHQVASTGVPCELLDVSQVIVVPQTRFYTAITVDAGASASAGGFAKASGAEDINFIAMAKSAVFADAKHQALRIFAPSVNQDADAWKFQFRIVHDCFLYDNKKAAGIYVHTKDAVS